MPAPLMHRKEVLARLLATFRDRGYDGASLDDLAAASGLGRSSLERLFPGGKEDMARQVLAHEGAQLQASVFATLATTRSPARKLDALLEALDEHYDGGRLASLLGRFAASAARDAFRPALVHAFGVWVEALEVLCVEAGLPRPVSRVRAEDAVVCLEGALVLSAGTGDHAVFQRTLKTIRASLLVPPGD